MRHFSRIETRFLACAAAKIRARFLLPSYDVIHFSPFYGLRFDSRFQFQQGLVQSIRERERVQKFAKVQQNVLPGRDMFRYFCVFRNSIVVQGVGHIASRQTAKCKLPAIYLNTQTKKILVFGRYSPPKPSTLGTRLTLAMGTWSSWKTPRKNHSPWEPRRSRMRSNKEFSAN